MDEYGTLKPVEIILRRGEGRRKAMEAINQNGIHCMHIWKCHNKTVQLSYTSMNILKVHFLKVNWG
jgi:hypothetical protein